jgi:hypothetical protein
VLGFARATEIAATNAVRLADDIASLDAQIDEDFVAYRRAQGLSPAVPRRDSVARRILERLAAEPVLTLDSVAERHGVSTTAAHRALTLLADADILSRTKDQRGRLVCWTADRHLALVALTERSNRVGGADTAAQAPRSGPPRPEIDRLGPLRDPSGATDR